MCTALILSAVLTKEFAEKVTITSMGSTS
jgi:hypothetical protein